VGAYYNEHDPFAAAWLRELIADGLIAPGEVDERSIEDVRPHELDGYSQCHFFAGIGIWSLALRNAGWPDDRMVWTGSCPCQPFSAAGKGNGFDDERHLWPAFHWLIDQRKPELVLGEQVASKDGLAWLDLVQADVEASGYAFGAVDTCAAGFGAPHIRQRLYWMADANSQDQSGRGIQRPGESESAGDGSACERSQGLCTTVSLADAIGSGQQGQGWSSQAQGQRTSECSVQGGLVGGMADLSTGGRREECQDAGRQPGGDRTQGFAAGFGASGSNLRPGPLNGLWRDADWLCCTDGKWRPVAPGTFPLAPAGTIRNRVGMLRGAGNAINLAQAQGFVESVMDALGSS